MIRKRTPARMARLRRGHPSTRSWMVTRPSLGTLPPRAAGLGSHASPPIRFSLSELNQPTAVLSNEEIVRLVAAGVDEATVLARIAGARTAFRLQADDLLQLRQAGVSDRILEAMIKAR